MVKLKELKMQSFRSFADADIKFPDKGLVLIRGQNPETGDPSGAGKSSILLAIAYALDILPSEFSATDLQTWGSKVPMQVTLTLEADGQEVIIGRGKKNFLKIGERTITGSAAIAEEQVKLFGFTPDILKALTYRAQKTPGLFLSLAPAEKIEFLTAVLGLEAIEKAVDSAEKKAADIDVRLQVFRETLEFKRKTLTPILASDRTKLEEELQALLVKQVAIDSELEQLDKTYKVKDFQDKLAKAEAFLEVAKKNDADRRRIHDKELAVLHAQEPQFVRAILDCQHALEEIKTLEGRLKVLRNNRCYTCDQVWENDDNTAEQLIVQKEIRMYTTQANAIGHWNEELAKVQRAIKEKVFTTDPNIKKLEEVRDQLLQTKMDPNFTQRKHELALLKRDVANDIKMKEILLSNLAREEARFKKEQQDVDNLQIQVNELDAEYRAERDFVSMMGREGFLGVIFDDVLREIADEANARLANMANVTNVRIGFQTEKVSGKGIGRRQINAVVNVNGNQAKLKSGLSGGMQTSVEQQVDLAVITVISRRAGKTIGWLCLDEVFVGVGQVTFETALEVLREFAETRLVLVIDHASEFKENFLKVIDVVYANGQSVVV